MNFVQINRTNNENLNDKSINIEKKTSKGSFFADELSQAEMRQIIDDRIEYLTEVKKEEEMKNADK